MIRATAIFFALVLSVAAAVNQPLLVDAGFRAKETGPGWDGHDGRLGERGPWQFREITWRQHMPGISFDQARIEGPARICALRHVAWLVRSLKAHRVDPSAFNVALAWNAGLDQVLRSRAPDCAYLYAGDVARLYNNARTP